MRPFQLFSALLLASLTHAFAADATFAAAAGNWGTASNWSPAQVPTIGQSVDIPSGKAVTLDVDTPVLAVCPTHNSSHFDFRIT